MAIIRTVLGDIAPEAAGATLTHEHLRYSYAGCDFDHRNAWDINEVASDVAVVVEKGDRQYGIHTIVEPDGEIRFAAWL